MTDAKEPPLIVVGLGEALFDCFPDHQVLGGAPLNLAFHAHQVLSSVNGQGTVVSRVGVDTMGDRVLAALAHMQVNTNFIQRDSRHPTGRVDVTLDARQQATYVITENVAWDHLAWSDQLQRLAGSCAAVCFGTLAQRHATSAETIARFVTAAPQALRVYDVNLRQDYFAAAIVERSCRAASLVKLNHEELPRVCQLLGLAHRAGATDEQAAKLISAFELDALALTRGKLGTVLYTPDQRVEGQPVSIPAAAYADSVGAGDACCAGLVCGLLLTWPLEQIVQFANELGAFVASCQGATPQLPIEILRYVRSPTELQSRTTGNSIRRDQ